MGDRSLRTVVEPRPEPGTGILHPFPTPELPHLDPFVFLDTGAPRTIGRSEIHVGPHPHRGVQPVSLVFRARIEHRDSLGNRRTVESGGMQWLVAGAGALHEEILQGDEEGVFHMAQLWVNVPRRLKSSPPEHHAIPADRVPTVTDLADGVTLRLHAGRLETPSGPVTGPAPLSTPVLIAHATLQAGARVRIPIPEGWTAAYTVVDGHTDLDGRSIGPGATAVFNDDGATMSVASSEGGEVLIMVGEPIGEPIVMGGGFVMTSEEEIAQAFDDYRAGRMGALSSTR